MKIKVNSSMRDYILKQKEEYEAQYNEQMSKYDEQYKNYKDEYLKVAEGVKQSILDAIGSTSLPIKIDTRCDFNDSINARVYVDLDHNASNRSLAWNFDASIDAKTGDVIKETGSWSGLNATTPEQLDDLEECVRVIRTLNGLDWKAMLKENFPHYSDYVKVEKPSHRGSAQFDKMLFEADVEDCIGKNILLKGSADSNNGRKRGTAYYMITKSTPSMYEYIYVPSYELDNMGAEAAVEKYRGFKQRTKKEKLIYLLNNPLETLEV